MSSYPVIYFEDSFLFELISRVLPSAPTQTQQRWF